MKINVTLVVVAAVATLTFATAGIWTGDSRWLDMAALALFAMLGASLLVYTVGGLDD